MISCPWVPSKVFCKKGRKSDNISRNNGITGSMEFFNFSVKYWRLSLELSREDFGNLLAFNL